MMMMRSVKPLTLQDNLSRPAKNHEDHCDGLGVKSDPESIF